VSLRALAAALSIAAALAPVAARADVLPRPGADNPRLQTANYEDGERYLLTVLPGTSLTLLLEPGERITRVDVSDTSVWRVTVSSEQDSLQVAANAENLPGTMRVLTDRRHYDFALRTDRGLTAAYVVQFHYGELPPRAAAADPLAIPAPETPTAPALAASSWRLTGDSAVRPATIADDGAKITLTFAPDQALPAVLALGPTGDEEVVNGYMRGQAYVIDRVYDALVFRIDKERAIARRSARP
jgi:type IV secretion system protein VirB9